MNLDTIYNEDCLVGMRRLPDNSVDLIATDPPYFRVKGNAWDRQWDSTSDFIDWIGDLCKEWRRVLKPNGSLYVFASRDLVGKVEAQIENSLAIVNRITWAKPAFSTKAEMFRKGDLRSYFPATEEIIFAEHYGADNIAKGEAGYAAKCDELRGFLFEPLRAYIVEEFEASGLDRIQLNVICGFSPNPGGMASRHYLSASQWCLPTSEHYARLAGATGRFRRPYETLRAEYETLRAEYETLRAEYETLRRPFTVSASVPFTDVWTFPTVGTYKGKHPCEKPLAMMEHIITASSRPGAVVLDPFLGSGTTVVAALNTGRRYIGFETDPAYFASARQRILSNRSQLALAAA